jgi:hypothetical protein
VCVMRYMLYATCCMLYVVCCMLYVICYMLYVICYMLYVVCYVLCYIKLCYAEYPFDKHIHEIITLQYVCIVSCLFCYDVMLCQIFTWQAWSWNHHSKICHRGVKTMMMMRIRMVMMVMMIMMNIHTLWSILRAGLLVHPESSNDYCVTVVLQNVSDM